MLWALLFFFPLYWLSVLHGLKILFSGLAIHGKQFIYSPCDYVGFSTDLWFGVLGPQTIGNGFPDCHSYRKIPEQSGTQFIKLDAHKVEMYDGLIFTTMSFVGCFLGTFLLLSWLHTLWIITLILHSFLVLHESDSC